MSAPCPDCRTWARTPTTGATSTPPITATSFERSADLPLALHRADTAALWSSTVTVEERDGFRGYSRIAHPDAGALADRKFEYGSGTPYEVQIVVAYADGVVFQVRNRGESLSDLTLEWAGETLPLSAATHDDDRFTWHPTWLNANAASLNASTYATTLPDGGTGTVCLRTSDQTCPSTTVTAPASTPAPLTAEFQDVPESHDGSTAFTVEIVFNEEPAGMNNQHLRRVLQVTGGDIRTVRRVNRDRAHRIVGIAPRHDGGSPDRVAGDDRLRGGRRALHRGRWAVRERD